MNDSNDQLLNENQRRALSTRLALLDRQLSEVEVLLSGEMAEGALFEITNDLTIDQVERLLSLLRNARERIEVLRERLALTVQQEDLRQKLSGYFSILWAVLEDSHAAKLKGFGEVSPELARVLDPEIDSLIQITNRIKSAVVKP